MGNMCAGKQKTPGEESAGSAKEKSETKEKSEEKPHTTHKEGEHKEKWEAELLHKNIDGSPFAKQAAILRLSDGSTKACVPKGFALDEKGVHAVVAAFGHDANSSQLTEHGLTIGESTYRPEGKETGGKVIVCTDGGQGGLILEKAGGRILVLVFKENREDATKLAAEISKSIEHHKD